MGLVMPEMPVMHAGEFFHAAGMEEQEKCTLPQSLVDQLPCRTSQGGCSERECSVCLSQFEAGDRLRRLPCKHEFQVTCIVLSMNRTCPCCRVDICDHACKERAIGTDDDVSAGEGASSDLEVLSDHSLSLISKRSCGPVESTSATAVKRAIWSARFGLRCIDAGFDIASKRGHEG